MNEAVTKLPVLPTVAQIEALEAMALAVPADQQVNLPCTHHFAPGVYIREMFAPADSFIIGHEHTTEHFNVLLDGAMIVLKDGVEVEICAPLIFPSPAGTRKVAFVTRAVRFLNVFPLAGLEALGQDVPKLEDALRVKSETYKAHELKQLQQHAEKGVTP